MRRNAVCVPPVRTALNDFNRKEWKSSFSLLYKVLVFRVLFKPTRGIGTGRHSL